MAQNIEAACKSVLASCRGLVNTVYELEKSGGKTEKIVELAKQAIARTKRLQKSIKTASDLPYNQSAKNKQQCDALWADSKNLTVAVRDLIKAVKTTINSKFGAKQKDELGGLLQSAMEVSKRIIAVSLSLEQDEHRYGPQPKLVQTASLPVLPKPLGSTADDNSPVNRSTIEAEVESLPLHPRAGQEAVFNIWLKQGIRSDEELDVEIFGPSQPIAHMDCNGGGSFVITWLVSEPGQYEIELWVGEIELKGSPFVVEVLPGSGEEANALTSAMSVLSQMNRRYEALKEKMESQDTTDAKTSDIDAIMKQLEQSPAEGGTDKKQTQTPTTLQNGSSTKPISNGVPQQGKLHTTLSVYIKVNFSDNSTKTFRVTDKTTVKQLLVQIMKKKSIDADEIDKYGLYSRFRAKGKVQQLDDDAVPYHLHLNNDRPEDHSFLFKLQSEPILQKKR